MDAWRRSAVVGILAALLVGGPAGSSVERASAQGMPGGGAYRLPPVDDPGLPDAPGDYRAPGGYGVSVDSTQATPTGPPPVVAASPASVSGAARSAPASPPASQDATSSSALPAPSVDASPGSTGSTGGATVDGASDAVAVGDVEKWFWAEYWDPWEGNVEFGMNGTAGNTQTFNVRLGANGKYKSAARLHSFQLVYLEKSVDQVNTAQTALADGRIEWPWEGSRWNYFVHGLAEYDEFRAFDVRLSGDTGLGYEFVENDRTTMVGRFGLSASREVGGPDDAWQPELLFGLEYKHKFSDKHSIGFKADYYPTIDDFTDFRLNSQASWEMAVAPEWGLSLKFSVIDRYDSTPHGARPNDLDYSTLLIWAF